MAGFSERLQFIIDANGAGAISTFKNVGDSAATNLGGVQTHATGIGGAFEKAAAKSPLLTGALDKVGLSGQQAGSMIQTALPAAALAGGAAIGAFAVKAVGDFQDLALSVLNFQRVSGATAEEASRFVVVLDDYGIAAEVGAKAIQTLGRNVENAPEKFERFGIEIAKNEDGTNNLHQTLLNAAEAYQSSGDAAEKAAISAALFGARGGKELVPLLEKGADGAEGLAAAFEEISGQQILTQEQLNQAEDTMLALDRLSDAAHELTLAVGSGLSPVVEDFANRLSGVTDAANTVLGPIGGLDTAIGFLGKSLIAGSPVTAALKEGFDLLGFGADEAKVKMEDLSGIAGGDFTTAMDLARESTDAHAQALAFGMTPASVIAESALVNQAEATDKKKQADDAAKEASDRHTDALNAQKAAGDALLASTNSLINSDLALRNAQDTTEGAVNEMQVALWNAAAAGYGDAAANEALDDATRNAEGAIIAEAAAAVKAAEDNATMAGETLNAAEKADVQKAALEGLKNKFPDLNSEIQAMIDKLNAIPKTVNTNVHTSYTFSGNPGDRPPGAGGSRSLAVPLGGRQPVAASGGATFNLTVNAGMGANGNQIGNEIIRAIKVWEMSNGDGWRR